MATCRPKLKSTLVYGEPFWALRFLVYEKSRDGRARWLKMVCYRAEGSR